MFYLRISFILSISLLRYFITLFEYCVYVILLRSLNLLINADDRAIYPKEYIPVKKGLFYRSYDKLYIKDINNIELYRSLGGKLFGYCTLNFYAIGGLVQIPYVIDNTHNVQIIKQIVEATEQNQKIK